MPHFPPDLPKRIVGGAAVATIAAVDIWFGGLAFALLLSVCAILLVREFLRLTVPESGLRTIALVVFWPLLAIAGYQASLLYWHLNDAQAITLSLWLTALGCAILTVLKLAFGVSRWLAFAAVYVAVPILALQWLREASDGHGLVHVAWLVAVIVATDCAAYGTGRAIGGPKLAPALSPGKTWSGLAGGMSGAALTGALASALMPGWSWLPLMVTGAALAALAQAGDLFESWLKRRAGRKDSGSLIPGHGGLMDRLDGYMTATPAFALLIAVADGSS